MSHYACKYRIVYGDEWETCDAVITKENRLCDYHEIQSLKEELTKLRADLEKQTNARKSEETARMYYVEQVNKLRTALDESIKVIQFYGDEKNWRDIVAEESFGTYCGLTEGCFDSIIYEDCENDIGGKTAREFLSKHKELIKGEV
jgi:hypothetical protein